MDEEVRELVQRYGFDAQLEARLVENLRGRARTFTEDMQALRGALRAAANPRGALSLKLREMEGGTFRARGRSPPARSRSRAAARAGRERARGREPGGSPERS
ncbi:unnamed protein product [Prorocentrum cordatum]|uniref:Uncharacterized protein n=1 Tax=Prorocentrum cordatum TaxID=2364126 RepID=A0ABN9YG89_9DINO|nr:unnamed protein product [Polarella glacialis]